MRIRPASIAEVAAVDAKIFVVSGPPSDEEFRQSKWWVAETEAGELVAYAGVWLKPSKKAAYLTRAGVLPEARGQGLQRRLLRVRERYARAQGAERTYTYVLDTNFPSMTNLIRCGYFPYYSTGDGYIWLQKALRADVKLRAYVTAEAVD